jgi:hypothetical protein
MGISSVAEIDPAALASLVSPIEPACDSLLPANCDSLSVGTSTFWPHLGQTAFLPARNAFTWSLCPPGQRNLMPIALVQYDDPERPATNHLLYLSSSDGKALASGYRQMRDTPRRTFGLTGTCRAPLSTGRLTSKFFAPMACMTKSFGQAIELDQGQRGFITSFCSDCPNCSIERRHLWVRSTKDRMKSRS